MECDVSACAAVALFSLPSSAPLLPVPLFCCVLRLLAAARSAFTVQWSAAGVAVARDSPTAICGTDVQSDSHKHERHKRNCSCIAHDHSQQSQRRAATIL